MRIVIICLFVCLVACQSNNKANPLERTVAASNELVFQPSRQFLLSNRDDLVSPGEIISFMGDGEKFYVLDGFKSQQAYVYDYNGNLLQLFSKPGQGPGEYKYPGGFCKNGNRIHLFSGANRYLIFDGDGNFLENKTDLHPGGVENKVFPGPDGTFFFTIYSRFSPEATIFHVSADGDLLNKFSPPDEDFISVWDLFAPMGDICFVNDKIYQVFNHKYEVKVFSLDGVPLETISLHSVIYREPDYETPHKEMKKDGQGLSGRKAVKFMEKQSLVGGIYTYGKDGFVTLLRYTNLKSESVYLEFWDNEFKGLGRMEVPESEVIVGTFEGQLVFFNADLGRIQFGSFIPKENNI